MLYIAHTGRRHVYFKQLHDQYGPYVRIGMSALCSAAPSGLTMSCYQVPMSFPFVMQARYSPSWAQTECQRVPVRKTPPVVISSFIHFAEWDARMLPNPDIPPVLIGLRSPAEHTARRRIWARAFTAASIKEYHQYIVKRANQLVEIIYRESEGQGVVDMSKWIGRFTFDFMGDMVFSGGFETMSETKDHDFMKLMHKNLEAAAHVEQLPWASRLFFKLPSVTKNMIRFKNRAIGTAKARYESKEAGRDLFFHLVCLQLHG